MVMISHKCVPRDINKYLVKQSGEGVEKRRKMLLNKVKKISSRLLNSESLKRNKVCDVSKLFRPWNSFTKHMRNEKFWGTHRELDVFLTDSDLELNSTLCSIPVTAMMPVLKSDFLQMNKAFIEMQIETSWFYSPVPESQVCIAVVVEVMPEKCWPDSYTVTICWWSHHDTGPKLNLVMTSIIISTAKI